ncbi:polysaccharide deacetylase family protein [Polaromonas naphthalenivorans]|uniref:NodB homology domain-containing protein n=1 Tax=Polaromonas naphthalenivorans (strain CJ2) TaxID=365044 RepID=A1VRW5_POLNA|nr:hypothetical protein [Polaromonas naphthalenivorans]ABM38393.1 conserved hypothetical protein [Polaromonas naphthalenivorans CJ2]
MKKVLAVTRITIIAAALLIGFFAWGQSKSPAQLAPASIALLLPDDLAEDAHFIRMWLDAAHEEGVRLQPIKVSDWVRTALLRGVKWEGVILPDTFHRRVDDSVVKLLRSYVADGGHLMLVYDGGLLTANGFYPPGKSRFSDLAGVDYGMYEELGQGLAKRSQFGLAQASVMEQLHIPPGRFASKEMTFPVRAGPSDDAHADFSALIFDYSKLPQSFATLVTRGKPSQPLMSNEDGGTLASRHRFGKGETLFVNFPLTYLKQRTDGIFLHSFLRYFAGDMLYQPRLAGTPDGKGGIVLNWHVDAKPALPSLKLLKDAGIFNEGPFSFHFTAGPDVNLPGDGGGLNVPNDPEVRGLIKGLMAQGHALGNHGGWIHNYFGNNINAGNQADYEQYLTLNHQTMTEIAGAPPREYSAPVGNQPPWVTRWLESRGFVGYYQTGNVGMGPTHAWLDTQRMSSMWAFPVLTVGPVATAEDAFFQHVPAANYENWLNEVGKFVEREQVLRLVYFHPPGAVLYLNAVNRFVNTIKACREAGRCNWITMTQAADFLTRREQVQWQLDSRPGGLLLKAQAEDLAHMAWWIPKRRFARPVVTEGTATIDEHGDDWRITATAGKQLSVSLKNL